MPGAAVRRSTLFGLLYACDGVEALTAPYSPLVPLKVHQQVLVLPLPANGVMACPLRVELSPSPVSAMLRWLRA